MEGTLFMDGEWVEGIVRWNKREEEKEREKGRSQVILVTISQYFPRSNRNKQILVGL